MIYKKDKDFSLSFLYGFLPQTKLKKMFLILWYNEIEVTK